MSKYKLNTIDLFAGCGGLMDGFEADGHYRTLACVEWEQKPCDTLRNRLKTRWNDKNAKDTVIRFDIQRTDELINGFNDSEYGSHPGLKRLIKNKKIDIIIGGPPCQAYSLAGRIRDEHGMKNDYRNYLFESYIRIVQHYMPDFFVFENVTGMLSAAPDGTPIINKIYSAFRTAGYYVIQDFNKAVFDVADFGIPQHRRRIIILGIRQGKYITEKDPTGEIQCEQLIKRFYEEELPKLKSSVRNVKDAIGDLPKFYPLDEPISENRTRFSHQPTHYKSFPNHIPRFHSKRDIEVFKLLEEDIESGNNLYQTTDSLKQLYTKITGAKSNVHKYHVLRWDLPSNTIPAHLNKDGLRHIHPDPEQARSITVREAARLQTFDDDFEFLGPMTDQFKMIGNAVPPLFAKKIATALYRIFNY